MLSVAAAVAAGLVAYAVYFDYKRRNDVAFRKKLRASLPRSLLVVSAIDKLLQAKRKNASKR